MSNKLIKLQGSSLRVLRASEYLAGYAAGSGVTIVDPISGAVYYASQEETGPIVIPPEIHQQGTGPLTVALADPYSYTDPYTPLAHTSSIAADGTVTITPVDLLEDYAVLIAGVSITSPSEAEQQAGFAFSGSVGMFSATTTNTQPTITGFYDASNYSDLAIVVDGTSYIASEAPAGLTVGSGTWSLNLATAGQTLAVGSYVLSISQLGIDDVSFVTPGYLTITAPVVNLVARYNGGTELHDAGGHIARDGSSQYTGVTVQDHVSEGDPVGLPVWYDAQSGTTYNGIRGTPYSAQNSGIRAASIGADDFVEYVFPDDLNGMAFTILLGAFSLSAGDCMLFRTEVGGIIALKNSGGNNVQATLRDNNDAIIANTGAFFGGVETYFWAIYYDPAVPIFGLVGTEVDGANVRAGSTTTFTGTPWISTTHLVFGGASRPAVNTSLVAGWDAMTMRIYRGAAISDSAAVRRLWDPTEPGYDPTGGGTLWRDYTGVRHGVEMTASPTDPYPVRSGIGAYPTAEDEV